MSTYKYQPLGTKNEIRLVVLHAGSRDEQISCSLTPYALPTTNPNTRQNDVWSWEYTQNGWRTMQNRMRQWEEEVYTLDVQRKPYIKSQYDALSYAWGDPSPTHLIALDDQEVLIPINLHDALQRLRLATQKRVLWIDAICIDQKNIPERSQQVQMMRQIFSSAASVIVWLGQPLGNIREAFEFIKDLNNRKSAVAQNKFSTDSPSILTCSNTTLKGLSELFKCPWWERIWVVQEVVAAAEVVIVCGNIIIPWAFLSGITTSIRKFEFDPRPKAKLLRNCQRRRFTTIDNLRNSPSMTLLRLLRDTRVYKATDPRDKVYALLGLASDVSGTELYADYRKSTATVFQDVVRFMIKTHGDLQVISSGGFSLSQPELPSWLPRWQALADVIPFVGEGITDKPYKASGGTRAIVNMSTFPTMLQARGIRVDKVDFLGGSIQTAHESMSVLRRWEYIATEFFKFSKHNDTFWRTIIADKTDTGKRATPEFGKVFRHFLDDDAPPYWDYEFSRKLPALKRTFSDAVNRAALGRRFFITRKGYMGLGPSNISIGDMLCVLEGCQVPLALRSVESHQLLVGEAYVHGIMDGEVMENGGYTSQMFYLK